MFLSYRGIEPPMLRDLARLGSARNNRAPLGSASCLGSQGGGCRRCPAPASCWPCRTNAEVQFGPSPRMIQEEKESTELRAEEIETRVTSGSMEALNLTQLRKRGSIPTSLTALSLASASPPLSGRSTPKLTSRSAAQDLDRMGVMTLVRVLGS